MKAWKYSVILVVLSGCQQEETALHGYVEGEYTYIAAGTPGKLAHIQVAQGDQVLQGDSLFALESTPLDVEKNSAKARLQQSQKQLENLTFGQRPEELEVIRKQEQAAEVTYSNAAKEYKRAKALAGTGALSQIEYDAKESAYKSAQAQLNVVKAQMQAARLAARHPEIEAAEAAVTLAQESVTSAEYSAGLAAPKAPADGLIQDVFYQTGEYVTAGQPVVSLLTPADTKIKFFVAQADLPHIKPEQTIDVSCDGCSSSYHAKIQFISDQAEYAPPVIYSNESRAKLVYLVEAVLDEPNAELKPGLPVDIQLR